MDRNKKLILVGAAGLFLLVTIIILIVLAVRGNKQPVEPEPTPIETIEPTAMPTEASTPTLEPTPAATPVAPIETPTLEPEETAEPSPSPEMGAPTLPGSSSNTPKPTQKPTATATPSFDFTMPSTATVGTKFSITVSSKNIVAVEWLLIKKGGIEIEVNADNTSDAEATLTKNGGSISFKNTGSYTLKAIATTTEGLRHTVSRSIDITVATAPTPAPGNPNGAATTSGFAFGLPKAAYTDTIITISVPAGSGAVTWSVTKDGKELTLANAFAGKLSDDGGMIAFKSEGNYVLAGTIASGDTCSASIAVKKRLI